MSRPVLRLLCPWCGYQVADCDTVVMFLCPEKPGVKHIQWTCRGCDTTWKIPASIAPSTITYCGGRIVRLTWVDELNDPARRSKLAPFTTDDVIDWHARVAETITLRDWERR